jgi:hypothetical protein
MQQRLALLTFTIRQAKPRNGYAMKRSYEGG